MKGAKWKKFWGSARLLTQKRSKKGLIRQYFRPVLATQRTFNNSKKSLLQMLKKTARRRLGGSGRVSGYNFTAPQLSKFLTKSLISQGLHYRKTSKRKR